MGSANTEASKQFFFEKTTKKLLRPSVRVNRPARVNQSRKSFLVLFFKKELLSACACLYLDESMSTRLGLIAQRGLPPPVRPALNGRMDRTAKSQPNTGPQAARAQAERAAREAAALRANLLRRKAQARLRADPAHDDLQNTAVTARTAPKPTSEPD